MFKSNLNMKKAITMFLFLLGLVRPVKAQEPFPTRGFCIAAPSARQLDTFVKFIDEELGPRKSKYTGFTDRF